jgi:hypothetical protein
MSKGKIYLIKHITRKMLRENPDSLFVFGDNFERKGFGGQAQQMRGEPNAVGIATKHKPTNEPDAFFSDDDEYRPLVEFAEKFNYLRDKLNEGVDIYIPANGIGTGLSGLKKHAPKIWEELIKCFDYFLDVKFEK